MKKDYMARLERAARWRLPPQEAEDVIADYRDIVADPPRSEDQLRREVGDPVEVIKLLVAPPKVYRTWLAVFAVMAACVLIPGHSGFGWFSWPFYRLCFEQGGLHLGPVLAVLGGGLALFWFRRQKGATKAPVPRGLIAALTALLVWIGLALLLNWAICYDLDGLLALGPRVQVWPGPLGDTEPFTVFASKWALILLPFFASFLAVYWLVRARTRDRRWTAAYILTLAAILVSLETIAQMNSMDVTSVSTDAAFRVNLIKCAVITAVGAVGTGVALR